MDDPVLIARGDRGEPVAGMKERLRALGYDPGTGQAPDEFGAGAEAALRAFQTARGLRVDGICGPQTLSALEEAGWSLGDRLLCLRRPMLRGDDVGALQAALNALGFDAGKEDGIFGPVSAAAVEEFQRNAGVTADGICGPETLTVLGRVGRAGAESVARSVAGVRERDALLREATGLGGRRVFVAAEPGLEALGEAVRRGLRGASAEVAVESTVDDESKLAAEANAWEADLVVLLRAGETCGCAFYERGDFRSERGRRLAQCLLHELGKVVGGPLEDPRPKTYALLRETRAPAVVCEVTGVGGVGRVGRAVVTAISRAVGEPVELEDSAS